MRKTRVLIGRSQIDQIAAKVPSIKLRCNKIKIGKHSIVLQRYLKNKLNRQRSSMIASITNLNFKIWRRTTKKIN